MASSFICPIADEKMNASFFPLTDAVENDHCTEALAAPDFHQMASKRVPLALSVAVSGFPVKLRNESVWLGLPPTLLITPVPTDGSNVSPVLWSVGVPGQNHSTRVSLNPVVFNAMSLRSIGRI